MLTAPEPDEGTSARVAQCLREQGYEAFALKGGYRAWKAAGCPLEPKEVGVATTTADVCPECRAPMADHVAE